MPIFTEVSDVRNNTSQQQAAQPKSQEVLAGSQGIAEPVKSVRPPTGDLGDRQGGTRSPMGSRGNAEANGNVETGVLIGGFAVASLSTFTLYAMAYNSTFTAGTIQLDCNRILRRIANVFRAIDKRILYPRNSSGT